MKLRLLILFQLGFILGCTNTGSNGEEPKPIPTVSPEPTPTTSPEPIQKQFKVYLSESITLPGEVEVTADLGNNTSASVIFSLPSDYAIVGQEYIQNTQSINIQDANTSNQAYCKLDKINNKCVLKLIVNTYNTNFNINYTANILNLQGEVSQISENVAANSTEAQERWRDIGSVLPKANYQNALPQLAFDKDSLVLGVNTEDKYDVYKLFNNNWVKITSESIINIYKSSASDNVALNINDISGDTYFVLPKSYEVTSLYKLESDTFIKINDITNSLNPGDSTYLNGLVKYNNTLRLYFNSQVYDLNANIVSNNTFSTSYGRAYINLFEYSQKFYSMHPDNNGGTTVYSALFGSNQQYNAINQIPWRWYTVSKFNTVLIDNYIYFVVSNIYISSLYQDNSTAYIMSYNLTTGEYNVLMPSIPGYDLFQCGNKLYTIGSYQDINFNKYSALYSYDIEQHNGWQMYGGYGFEYGYNNYVKFDDKCTPYVSYLSYKDLSRIKVVSYQ